LNPLNSRCGRTVTHATGYAAFVPKPLPPDPPLAFDGEMIRLLSEADLALGALSGVASLLPNPDLFVAMYVRKEAVLSSQIEGIQCTLDDVLVQENSEAVGEGVSSKAIGEVVNYVQAMNHGIARLPDLPLSLRMIREIHQVLLDGVRGTHKDPGEFRRSQNWIGPQGCTLTTATFVPPSVPDMETALSDLEKFLHDRTAVPLTIQCALVHLQFETIHPFLDGNGRVGRLLIALLMHERSVLKQPLLYLSLYLKRNRVEYYDRLMDVRVNGNWEGWVKFFLRGIAEVSRESAATAQKIVGFRDMALATARGIGKHEAALTDLLFERPIIDIRAAEKMLGTTYATASQAVTNLEKAGYLKETTGMKRNKVYRFSGYLDLFDEPEQTVQSTQLTDVTGDC
jgi:cell filamentation protein, protein adenylyltransferase